MRSNFSGYSDANTASPTPAIKTPAGLRFLINSMAAVPADAAKYTAFPVFHADTCLRWIVTQPSRLLLYTSAFPLGAGKHGCNCIFRTLTLPASRFVLRLLAQSKPRARDLGVPLMENQALSTPSPMLKVSKVSHTTLISGKGKLQVGVGPVRTGVTAVLPRGRASSDPVFAAWFTMNGNGEMTGTTWVEDSGSLDGPVMITNTHSVGVVPRRRNCLARETG